jgi:hypothetical protein
MARSCHSAPRIPPHATVFPSGENATLKRAPARSRPIGGRSTFRSLPVLTSHIRAVLSVEAVAIYRLPGSTLIFMIPDVWVPVSRRSTGSFGGSEACAPHRQDRRSRNAGPKSRNFRFILYYPSITYPLQRKNSRVKTAITGSDLYTR